MRCSYQNGEKTSYRIYMLILLVLLLYSIFLPLKLGTLWFVIGLAIYLGGLTILLATFINVASTPIGRPFTRGDISLFKASRVSLAIFNFCGDQCSLCFLGFILAFIRFPTLAEFNRHC